MICKRCIWKPCGVWVRRLHEASFVIIPCDGCKLFGSLCAADLDVIFLAGSAHSAFLKHCPS